MRTFEERKAEILRRSSERISKRKTIKRCVLGVTIPLFICAFSLTVLLNMSGIDKSKKAEELVDEGFFGADINHQIETDDLDVYYTQITVSDNKDNTKNITDGDVINEVTSIINTYLPQSTGGIYIESSTAATAQGNNDTLANNDGQKHNTNYKIEIANSKGDKSVYHLNGNLLTNIQSGEDVILDDDVRNELLKSLGF